MIYKYDNSFRGFLSVVFEVYTRKKIPDLITGEEVFQIGFENEIIDVKTIRENAERIEKSLIKHLKDDGYESLYNAFCSSSNDKEILMFNYIRLVFKFEESVLNMLSNTIVINYNMMVFKVTHEIARMKGFVRFKELSNSIFYAQISPDNDITLFLVEYFSKRDNSINFIIHDTKRNIMGLYNGNTIQLISCDRKISQILSEDEVYFTQLWQQYFNAVSIDSRKNKRLQDNFLPIRYRKNMSEFQQI